MYKAGAVSSFVLAIALIAYGTASIVLGWEVTGAVFGQVVGGAFIGMLAVPILRGRRWALMAQVLALIGVAAALAWRTGMVFTSRFLEDPATAGPIHPLAAPLLGGSLVLIVLLLIIRGRTRGQ